MYAADGYSPTTDWSAPDPAAILLAARAHDMFTMRDLFLPEDARLRDDDRAAIAAVLAGLIADVEQALRERLARSFADHSPAATALAAMDIPIARPILDRAGVLADPALVAALAGHAARERLAARLLRRRDLARSLEPDGAGSPLERLAADADAAIAAAARACLASEGAFVLSAELHHRLVWRIAAALRDYLTGPHAMPGEIVDPRIAASAEDVLAGYDEATAPAARTRALAIVLRAADRLGDALADQALAAGDVPLAVAVLAVRAGIGFDAAWDMTTDPNRLMLLCRAADLPPAEAAAITLRLDPGNDDEALASRVEGYASLPHEGAMAAIALWRCDPAYRESILALGLGRAA